MTNVTDYDPVECPVADCEYRDRIRSVAGHVSGSDDDGHSWSRLGYDGARDFVMTEKRRQREDGDGSAVSQPTADSTETPGEAFEAATDPDPFELGIEREALLLLDLAREYDFETLDDLDRNQLTDIYTLLSDLKSSADDARKEVRDALIETTRDDGEITADLGSVSRYTYERRSLKDDAAVRSAVRDAGVDPVSVRSFDSKKLREVAEDGALDERAVFDFEERTQIRKGKANENGRWERFQRLPDELRAFAEDD
ncbi:hypothetical protein [Halorussus amylolyticus]|uniref:hypothetical protein n=1 Tax=Halorussus amylolyticus TaxID=1126242 RepID=UPI001050176C|nr:hypothetical protein [Halorussus amylolyticus]